MFKYFNNRRERRFLLLFGRRQDLLSLQEQRDGLLRVYKSPKVTRKVLSVCLRLGDSRDQVSPCLRHPLRSLRGSGSLHWSKL